MGDQEEIRLADVRHNDDKNVANPTVDEVNDLPGTDKILDNSGDAAHEVGIDLFRQAADLEITEDDSKRIRRKIDKIILPMFCVTQGLSYVDKVALNYGNIYGLKQTQNITTDQFAWYASAFYIGYLVFSWPANLILQRYPTGRVTGFVCVLWGVLSASFAGVVNFPGGIANRFILGCLESFVTPGLNLMTPLWYTLDEQPLRQMVWISFNGWGDAIGNLVSYGIGHSSSKLAPWAIIFIVFGSVSSLWGIFLFFFLPESPATARWLNENEKQVAIRRIASNRVGTKNSHWKVDQFWAAFLDPKTWFLFVATIGTQIGGSLIGVFSTAVISSLGFQPLAVSLLSLPADAVQISCMMVAGLVCAKFKGLRLVCIFFGDAICITAAAVLTYADQKWVRLVGYWFTLAQTMVWGLMLNMISANIGGYTKRITTNSIYFVGYCIGFIVGPHFIKASEAPRSYPTASTAMMAASCVVAAMHIFLTAYMVYKNRKFHRDAVERGEVLSEEERAKMAEIVGMTDVTEFENKYFRYVL